MKRLLLVFLVAGSFASGPALANPVLAKQRNCMACHAMGSKIIGPSFKDVAAKYAGQNGAEDALVQKVLKGSSGVWGGVMPANTQLSDAEAHTLIKWILAQK